MVDDLEVREECFYWVVLGQPGVSRLRDGQHTPVSVRLQAGHRNLGSRTTSPNSVAMLGSTQTSNNQTRSGASSIPSFFRRARHLG
jgi:hypothetical protein